MTHAVVDAIQRLKVSCIVGETRPSEDLYLEFVAAYKTIYRSLQQHLDRSNFGAAGGLAPWITKLEIHHVCEDGATFINVWFLPFAGSLDDRVFLLKSCVYIPQQPCRVLTGGLGWQISAGTYV